MSTDRILSELVAKIHERQREELSALRVGPWEQVLQGRGRLDGLDMALNALEDVLQGLENDE